MPPISGKTQGKKHPIDIEGKILIYMQNLESFFNCGTVSRKGYTVELFHERVKLAKKKKKMKFMFFDVFLSLEKMKLMFFEFF